MNQSLSRLGLALALCSGLFLTGCDDDDDNPSSPSSPAPVEPSPSPSPSTAPTPSPSPSPDDSLPQAGDRANFLGRLKSVSGTELKVGSQTVMVDANTTYDRGGVQVTLDNFQIGEIVHVRGFVQNDRTSVLATRINIPAPSTDDDDGTP